MKALADPKIFHGALDCCFSGGRPRNVWRIDRLKENLYVLILSEEKTDFSSFCKKFSPSESSWETKDYEPLLSRLKKGDTWRFKLSANPTYRVGEKGKITAHAAPKCQKEWLMKKSLKNGFQLESDGFDVIENKWFKFRKDSTNAVTILSVTYEGLLMITDVELFRKALVNGIGRGKAYGMGLLTVVRA